MRHLYRYAIELLGTFTGCVRTSKTERIGEALEKVAGEREGSL